MQEGCILPGKPSHRAREKVQSCLLQSSPEVSHNTPTLFLVGSEMGIDSLFIWVFPGLSKESSLIAEQESKMKAGQGAGPLTGCRPMGCRQGRMQAHSQDEGRAGCRPTGWGPQSGGPCRHTPRDVPH